MERLSGLEHSAGLRPAARWQAAIAYDMNNSIWPAHDSDHVGFGLVPPPAGVIPMSRHEIDTLLARHIHDDWTGTSDLMLPYPPPPMDEQSLMFFGLAGDNDPPVPFPEPAIGFALPLIALSARRQRRRAK
jgi:hypothetical protein